MNLHRNYFSVSTSVLVVVFCQPILKKIILPEIVGFFKFIGEIQQLVRKRSQKKIRTQFCYISLPIYRLHFPKFCPIQKNKNR